MGNVSLLEDIEKRRAENDHLDTMTGMIVPPNLHEMSIEDIDRILRDFGSQLDALRRSMDGLRVARDEALVNAETQMNSAARARREMENFRDENVRLTKREAELEETVDQLRRQIAAHEELRQLMADVTPLQRR